MKAAFSSYLLRYQSSLGMEKVGREGALIRVILEDGTIGYADCHPWVEVGDEPLEVHIASLKEKPTKLIRQSIENACLYPSLNQFSMKVPRNHFLGFNLLNWTLADSNRITEEGFTHVKFKVGRNPELEAKKLQEIANHSSLHLRLDFNHLLSFEKFQSFLDLIEDFRDRIDYIEDPFPYDEKQWAFVQKQGWTLAADRQVKRAFGKPEVAKVLIIKPAVMSMDEVFQKVSGQTKIVTTYLGHPVEQVFSASVALQLDPECHQLHGLLSHRIYEPTIFSEKLNWRGNEFRFPASFYGELDKLNWEVLC